MAHFAKIGPGNIVEDVIVISNSEAPTEEAGQAYINSIYGTSDVWKKTSYNTKQGIHILGGIPFRKNYAGKNYIYDENRDAFIAPKPTIKNLICNSWVLNEDKCVWEPPIAFPNDGFRYIWDESIQNWEKVE